jgi:hypothetical protein
MEIFEVLLQELSCFSKLFTKTIEKISHITFMRKAAQDKNCSYIFILLLYIHYHLPTHHVCKFEISYFDTRYFCAKS